MLYRPKSFNLTNKLSFLLIVSIVMTVTILQIYFNTFLAQKYREQAQQRINYTLDHFTTRVGLIKKELREGVLFIQDDESFIASIELINNYQDTQNYPAILLDEEKKRLRNNCFIGSNSPSIAKLLPTITTTIPSHT